MQAANPALDIFTASGGGTSEGLSPTMLDTDTHRQIKSHQSLVGYKCNLTY